METLEITSVPIFLIARSDFVLGDLIVQKRVKSYDASEYRGCPKCLGFYHKDSLRKHISKEHDSSAVTIREIKRFNGALAIGDHMDEPMANVLSTMRADNIYPIVKNDRVILIYGKQLNDHYEHKKPSLVSVKMRELARLVQTVRNSPEHKEITMKELIQPGKFDTVVGATKQLCKLLPGKKTDSVPTLALKLGHALKKCAFIVRNLGIRQGTKEMDENARQYLELHESEWTNSISTYALDATKLKKKQQALPLTTDLKV